MVSGAAERCCRWPRSGNSDGGKGRSYRLCSRVPLSLVNTRLNREKRRGSAGRAIRGSRCFFDTSASRESTQSPLAPASRASSRSSDRRFTAIGSSRRCAWSSIVPARDPTLRESGIATPSTAKQIAVPTHRRQVPQFPSFCGPAQHTRKRCPNENFSLQCH